MSLQGMLGGLDIAASGLAAERRHMSLITQNIAMANVTRTLKGGPYVRKTLIFREALNRALGDLSGGVAVEGPVEDRRGEFVRVFDPSHPDADQNGYVRMPNVNVLREMVDLISAQRAYEANVAAINATKSMVNAALDIGRRG